MAIGSHGARSLGRVEEPFSIAMHWHHPARPLALIMLRPRVLSFWILLCDRLRVEGGQHSWSAVNGAHTRGRRVRGATRSRGPIRSRAASPPLPLHAPATQRQLMPNATQRHLTPDATQHHLPAGVNGGGGATLTRGQFGNKDAHGQAARTLTDDVARRAVHERRRGGRRRRRRVLHQPVLFPYGAEQLPLLPLVLRQQRLPAPARSIGQRHHCPVNTRKQLPEQHGGVGCLLAKTLPSCLVAPLFAADTLPLPCISTASWLRHCLC